MHQDLLYQIALTRIPNVGPVLAKNLISYCGSAEKIFSLSEAKLTRIPSIGQKTANEISRFKDFKEAEEEVTFIEKNQVTPLLYTDQAYPARLKELTDSPLILYYKGNADLNQNKVVSIVGTRHASAFGKDWTEQFVQELLPVNCLILSGLAYGIDGIAHKAAVKSQQPTVGVLGNGLKNIYPAANKILASQMVTHGGLLTEYISNTPPDRQNFPTRNRIVAAMSDVIVVVETKAKGGSMITATLGNSYQKDIFAVPGKPTDEWSEGCNLLIKTNRAGMVESAADLIHQMRWDAEAKPAIQPTLFPQLDGREEKIYTLIKERGKSGIDEIQIEAGISVNELSTTLLTLEMRDIIKSLPGKYYELKTL
jgi:DNA processing protein